MNSAVKPIFNIFFLSKVAVSPMNGTWIVLLQCVNSNNCLPETREKKKEKKKENAEIWNVDACKRESKNILNG